MDKNIEFMSIRLKRCIKRYHRALFVWYIAAILNNIIVLFDLLFPSAKTLRKNKARIGYRHWFQNALGNGLIDHGISLCKEAVVEGATASAAVEAAASSSASTHEGKDCSSLVPSVAPAMMTPLGVTAIITLNHVVVDVLANENVDQGDLQP